MKWKVYYQPDKQLAPYIVGEFMPNEQFAPEHIVCEYEDFPSALRKMLELNNTYDIMFLADRL